MSMQTKTLQPLILSDYEKWENAITEHIAKTLGTTFGEAAGIVEANTFVLSQNWANDTSAEETARLLLIKKSLQLWKV